VNLLPFLMAAFYLINPVLEWIFGKLGIPKGKLQFWIMLTSGTAWVLALVYFLLNPQSELMDISATGLALLPGLVFSHDWLTASLILSAAALIFITILTKTEEPQSNAWLASLGGAVVIGLVTNSAYSVGLAWVLLEGFHFYFSYQDQQIASNPRKYLPVALMRLSAPAVLILLSLTGRGSQNPTALLTELESDQGLVLIAVGLLGFLGWFLSYQGSKPPLSRGFPGPAENWLPGMLGLYLILRGGSVTDSVSGWIPLILSGSLLAATLTGLLFGQTPQMWFLSCGLMTAVAAVTSGPESALIWVLVMILPGVQSWKRSSQPKNAPIPLALAIVGLLPVPFLPSWAGISAFNAGLPGMILGISYGVLLGSVLATILKNWGFSAQDRATLPVLDIIGACAILISQFLISFRLDLITSSRDLLNKPLVIWIGLLGALPVLILGNRFPLRDRNRFSAAVTRLTAESDQALSTGIHFLDRLVGNIARIFEGQGGLIWALLIGLLLFTLISFSGG